jgi:hypothetical protein
MPAKLERELKAQAEKKGLTGAHKDAYVYGTMRKTGWKPSTQHSPIEGPEPLTHLDSIYTRNAPIERGGEAFDSRPFDMHSVGKDWCPRTLDERIYHREDDTQEEYDVENGILFYPGEKESTQD